MISWYKVYLLIGCILGKYGNTCAYDCSTHCIDTACNISTGNCVCAPGYQGGRCSHSKCICCHYKVPILIQCTLFWKCISTHISPRLSPWADMGVAGWYQG
jgi:hypothetical protein